MHATRRCVPAALSPWGYDMYPNPDRDDEIEQQAFELLDAL